MPKTGDTIVNTVPAFVLPISPAVSAATVTAPLDADRVKSAVVTKRIPSPRANNVPVGNTAPGAPVTVISPSAKAAGLRGTFNQIRACSSSCSPVAVDGSICLIPQSKCACSRWDAPPKAAANTPATLPACGYSFSLVRLVISVSTRSIISFRFGRLNGILCAP